MPAKFRLQQVLEHKRQQEEEQTLELAALAAEQRVMQNQLRALRDKEEAQLVAMQEVARTGAINPGHFNQALLYLDAIEDAILQQLALIVCLDEKVLESRDVLIGILKEKQLLEKLHTQHVEDVRLADRRREGNQLDEIAGQRFQRGASEVS
jgi:flagellar export protein FliJ